MQVYFTPNIYFAIMKVVDSAKILATRSESDKKGDTLYIHMTWRNNIHSSELTESEEDKGKDVEPVDKQSGLLHN